MRTNILILIVGLSALSASAAAPEQANEIVIALSPFQPAAERAKHQALLQRFVVADCPNGSHVIVWDAWALTVVCDVQLPKLIYDTPAARAPRVAPALAALKQWFVGLDGKQTPAEVRDTGAIKVPEWLQTATAQPATDRRTIVMLASALSLVPTEPSFSMVETRYPSDGHLSAGDKSTIYSIAEKRGRLANTTVLWAYGSESVWASQNHRERVARWWSLFIAGQGPNAMLAAFSADVPQILLAATRTNHRAIGEYAMNVDDSAVVMHTATMREVPVKIETRPVLLPEPLPQPVTKAESPPPPVPVVVVVTPPPAPPVVPPNRVEEPPPAPEPEPPAKVVEETVIAIPVPSEIPKPAVGNVGIAAVWSAERGTDIDLWVAAKPGSTEAYWNRTRVERVRYFRDIRTSQAVNETAQWRTAWEYVEVERAQVTEPTVWLNVYAARGPVSGIVRVQFDGRVVDHPFQFNVAGGNRGRDSNMAARSRSPYWLEVRLDEIFKQTTSGHALSPASR